MLIVSNLIGACWDEIPNKTFQLSWSKMIPSSSEVTETPDILIYSEKNKRAHNTVMHSKKIVITVAAANC